MNYYEQLSKINVQARDKLMKLLSNVQEIKLFNLDIEWEEDDELYDSFLDLPAQFLYTKYGYAILYTLHRVYIEDEKLYIEGFDREEAETHHFTFAEIDAVNFCYLVDCIMETLN